jgi:hypothetical protein
MSSAIPTSVFERIAALDGTNYRSWAFSMKMLLKGLELWDVIEDYEEPAETAEGETSAARPKKKMDAKWYKKDQLALSCIALGLKPSEQEHIYNCDTAKDAWNCLKELYEGKGTHRFLSLLKSISTATLKGSMKDYIRGVRQTADQLTELDVKLDKTVVIGYILNGLPDEYRYLVVNLESQVSTISYEDLSARLMDEEKRITKDQELFPGSENKEWDPDIAKAHYSRTKGTRCYRCNRIGHRAADCEMDDGKFCEFCGMDGHDERECRVKRYQKTKFRGEPQKKSRGKPRAYLGDADSADSSDSCTTYSAIFGA